MDQEALISALEDILPKQRIKFSLIDRVAYSSDAGFYQLRPRAIVLPVSEQEVSQLFRLSQKHHIPIVFRTAGTSLSGQSITDGILVDLSQHWGAISIEESGACVRVQPGIIGAVVNAHLKKFGSKIGPDPASINSCMMGGIISNNSSGMCCGVANNAYHTMQFIRFMLTDGKVFSTENPGDYARFEAECPHLAGELLKLRSQIMQDPELYGRIRRKYRTKNTVGYSVNAFIDYDVPLDIFAHLLVGGEGTLAFISEAVLKTTADHPKKSTALIYFPDVFSACQAIAPLTESGAAAVELMDRASLRSVEDLPGLPAIIRTLPDKAAALLIEYQGEDYETINRQIAQFLSVTPQFGLLEEPAFTNEATEQAFLWKVRKGMFPAVGAVRASGTTVLMEDIAFPVDKLGHAILELQQLFEKYNYEKAIIFGHAKDGNIHFVVTQALDTPAEISRFDQFMQDLAVLVVDKYDGTLKAEHGTGRNMAPFVEKEWGGEIYRIMRRIKEITDPANLLNPGVIINADKNAHITHLKELPQVESEVDKCIECGFCEHKCPSRNFTLTPRRRIVVRRQMLKLKNNGQRAEYDQLLREYRHAGMDTCSVDGLCSTACPVDINTGELIKRLRKENHSALANKVALTTAKQFGTIVNTVRTGLYVGTVMNKIFGRNAMHRLTGNIRKVMPAFPLWSNQLSVARRVKARMAAEPYTVVYFTSCISRMMGPGSAGDKHITQSFLDVSAKAGIGVIIPQGINQHCCGQIYSSKGFNSAYEHIVNRTISYLWEVSEQGKLDIVTDVSSCTQTLQHCRTALSEQNKQKFDALRILDSVAYLHDQVLDRVNVVQKKRKIVLHPVCSIQKMDGMHKKFSAIAARFAEEVSEPLAAGCCGMAGDRGFFHPELTYNATRSEAREVNSQTFDGYYSSSKTCEIALSDAVGKNYHSILKLVDDCTA